ncbi:MAG: hypothetical protein WB779_03365 [Ignavibacteriaceae bacterium]|jgi:hypothetical protein
MWKKFNSGFSSVIVILAFSIAVLFSSNTVDAQSLWKVNSGPGGGGTTTGTTVPQDNNSHTGIYILAGAVVVGFLMYKFVFQESDDTEDTTNSNSSSLILLPSNSKLIMKVSNSRTVQETPPVKVYLGIRRDNYNTANEEKTYLVGLSFNF